MNDPFLASDRAISHGLAHFLTPPEDYLPLCEACGIDLQDCLDGVAGGCVRCSSCKRTGDCFNAVCCDTIEAAHYEGCGYPSKVCGCDTLKAKAEELHLEEGRDQDREGRGA